MENHCIATLKDKFTGFMGKIYYFNREYIQITTYIAENDFSNGVVVQEYNFLKQTLISPETKRYFRPHCVSLNSHTNLLI